METAFIMQYQFYFLDTKNCIVNFVENAPNSWLKNRYLYDTNEFNNYSFTDVHSYEEVILNGLKNG